MFKHIKPNQLVELQQQHDVQVVDIRDPQSYAMGHIPHAFLLDNSNVGQYIAAADFNRPLVVCCYHGNSSQGAAQYLAEQGFTDVYSLDGGFETWKLTQPDQIENGA